MNKTTWIPTVLLVAALVEPISSNIGGNRLFAFFWIVKKAIP
ncbi:hypothetical protein [Brevibacillus laterosporus]|nr:hypothetical protein [Brevibacillus laterosporus]